jgi:hypothetical protein
MGWSDRAWVLDGAAVRVSMIGFDNGNETSKTLDGISVNTIYADLTANLDLTVAKELLENQDLSLQGIELIQTFP